MIRGLIRFVVNFLFGRVPTSRTGTSFAVILSLLMATAMWLVVTLEKAYTVQVKVPFKAKVNDFDFQLSKKPPTSFEVEVTAVGSDLLFYYFYQPSDTFIWKSEAHEGQVTLEKNTLNREVSRVLPDRFVVNAVAPETVSLEFEKKVFRKVPLIWSGKLVLTPPYRLTGAITLTPDSVSIQGPRNLIDTIVYWTTRDTLLRLLPNMVTALIPLIDTVKDVSVNIHEVLAIFDQKKYTEARIRVPMTATQVPAGMEVSFMPDSVTFTCLVPMDKFNEVVALAKSWQSEVPFADLDPTHATLVPAFPNYLKEVQLIRRSPLIVHFLVKDKTVGL